MKKKHTDSRLERAGKTLRRVSYVTAFLAWCSLARAYYLYGTSLDVVKIYVFLIGLSGFIILPLVICLKQIIPAPSASIKQIDAFNDTIIAPLMLIVWFSWQTFSSWADNESSSKTEHLSSNEGVGVVFVNW